jgi:branched-chain amino acid transport system permease protein
MINSSSKKSVSAKSSLYIFGVLILIILLCIPIFIKSANWLQIMILILWYAGLTLSWNFVGGFAGVLPLGHAAYAGVGAYVSTLLFINSGLSPWIGMIIGGIVSALIALIIGIPTFKLHGAYYALASIAFVESIRMVVENTNEIFGIKVNGARGLLIPLEGHAPVLFQFGSKVYYYYVILFFVLLILFISYKIQKSKLGFYLVAGGEDQEAAESLGVNVTYQKLLALAISAFFMGLLGTFYAQLILYIYPLGIISMTLSFEIAFIAIIGGRGTLFGPILGSFILVPLAEISRMYLSGSRFLGIHLMLYSSIIVLVMLYIPGGLISIFERLFYPRGIDKLR